MQSDKCHNQKKQFCIFQICTVHKDKLICSKLKKLMNGRNPVCLVHWLLTVIKVDKSSPVNLCSIAVMIALLQQGAVLLQCLVLKDWIVLWNQLLTTWKKLFWGFFFFFWQQEKSHSSKGIFKEKILRHLATAAKRAKITNQLVAFQFELRKQTCITIYSLIFVLFP